MMHTVININWAIGLKVDKKYFIIFFINERSSKPETPPVVGEFSPNLKNSGLLIRLCFFLHRNGKQVNRLIYWYWQNPFQQVPFAVSAAE